MRPERFKQLDTYLRDVSRTPLMTAEEELSAAKQVARARRRLLAQVRATLAAAGLSNRMPKNGSWRALVRSAAAVAEQDAALGQRKAEIARLDREYQRACHRLLLPNLRLVLSIVNQCGARQEEILDLVQEGTLGLMRAVEKFDHQRGYRFSTYAFWWVRNAVLQAKLRHRSLCHITQTTASKQRKVRLARALLWQTARRPPTVRQTAETTGLPERSVESLERVRQPCLSLNRPHSKDDPREPADIIRDHREEDVSRRLDQELLKQRLGAILQELDARERQILCLRFGLAGGQPLSLQDIGRMMRLSRERIRQIEEGTMRKLRQPDRAARLVEFLDEPAAELLSTASQLRTVSYDTLLRNEQAREMRTRRLNPSAQEESPCPTSKASPDAA